MLPVLVLPLYGLRGLPLYVLGGEGVVFGGDVERTSLGDIDRIEADERFRWNGASNPEGVVSSLAFMSRRVACVES